MPFFSCTYFKENNNNTSETHQKHCCWISCDVHRLLYYYQILVRSYELQLTGHLFNVFLSLYLAYFFVKKETHKGAQQ